MTVLTKANQDSNGLRSRNKVFFFDRLTQAMIVLHEELMEEIYEWLNDAEKQADSIAVNNDDIAAVKDEYGRHRVIIVNSTPVAVFFKISKILYVKNNEDEMSAFIPLKLEHTPFYNTACDSFKNTDLI